MNYKKVKYDKFGNTNPFKSLKQIQWCSGVVVISVQRERSQRMDVLTTLLMGLMAFHGEVPEPELDQACEEREAALGRPLEGWEREIVKAFLTNERLKAIAPEERTSITNFDTVILFRSCSCQA